MSSLLSRTVQHYDIMIATSMRPRGITISQLHCFPHRLFPSTSLHHAHCRRPTQPSTAWMFYHDHQPNNISTTSAMCCPVRHRTGLGNHHRYFCGNQRTIDLSLAFIMFSIFTAAQKLTDGGPCSSLLSFLDAQSDWHHQRSCCEAFAGVRVMIMVVF